jgi:hypothetical protein
MLERQKFSFFGWFLWLSEGKKWMTRPSFSLKCGVCEHAEPKNFNAINEKNGKIFPFSITSTQNGTFV